MKFTDIVAPTAGQYAVTIYYRADSPTNVFVETEDGIKTRLSLLQPGIRDNYHPGENIGFRTALVSLKQGMNTLTIGNDEDGNAPMVDHIAVRPVSFLPAHDYECLTADGLSLESTITAKEAKVSGEYTIKVEKEGIYDITVFYMSTEDCDLSVATCSKHVPLSCPATGTGVKRVAASLRLKSGKNRITLLQEEGKSMEIRKLQAGFICDGKKQ